MCKHGGSSRGSQMVEGSSRVYQVGVSSCKKPPGALARGIMGRNRVGLNEANDQSQKGQRPEFIGLVVENPAGFVHLQQITSDR